MTSGIDDHCYTGPIEQRRQQTANGLVEYVDVGLGTENDWASWTGKPWLTPDSVTCPTLILHDRADTVVRFAHAEWAKQCIPAAELCELHTGGHLIWVGKDREKLRRDRTAFITRHFGQNRVS